MTQGKMNDRYTLDDYDFEDLFGGIDSVEIDKVIIPSEGQKTGDKSSGKYSGPIEIVPVHKLSTYPDVIRKTIEFLNDQGENGTTFDEMIQSYIDNSNTNESSALNSITNTIYRMNNNKVLTLSGLDSLVKSIDYYVEYEFIKVKEIEDNIIPDKKGHGKYTGVLHLDISDEQKEKMSKHSLNFAEFINRVGEKDGYTFETLFRESHRQYPDPSRARNVITNIFYRMISRDVFSHTSQEEVADFLGYKVEPVFKLDKDKYIKDNQMSIIKDDMLELK